MPVAMINRKTTSTSFYTGLHRHTASGDSSDGVAACPFSFYDAGHGTGQGQGDERARSPRR